MKFFCRACGTESTHREICSGCGSMMARLSDKHMFVLEIIDQITSREVKEVIVYERRGPFSQAIEATNWWGRHQDNDRYVGCTGTVAVIEPPTEIVDVDKSSN